FGEGDVTTMVQHLSLNPGEYSYFSPRTMAMWAGPDNWRAASKDPKKQPKKKAPKKPFELNFDEKIDFKPYFRKTKEPTTLSKAARKRHNVRYTTLPEDDDYDPDELLRLFLKPDVKVTPNLDPDNTLRVESDIDDYDYNNPNDTLNFCPAVGLSDSDEDSDPAEFLLQAAPAPRAEAEAAPEAEAGAGAEAEADAGAGAEAAAGAPEPSGICAGGGLELLPEPPKVKRFNIPYAKTEKTVDMRKLQDAMWELLTEQVRPETLGKGNSPREFCRDP
ncbi:CND2 protein, partial [Chaetops frenatus]|nr:CND2 protein [Chaetops frenatus]